MTILLSGSEISEQLQEKFGSGILESNDDYILIEKESVPEIITLLKESPEFDFNFLNYITAVDYLEYFELVYQLTSFRHNHSLVIKTRCYGRDKVTAPSITSLYGAADPQEREIYDLMGISFDGHPNMTRIFLWEGFEGHPLRRDYL